MGIRIGFITGARSDFGVMKPLIFALQDNIEFEVNVYVTGMHLLNKYGNTFREIEKLGIKIREKIKCYSEEDNLKVVDFTTIVKRMYRSLKDENLDVVYIVGDRIEAYASALAAHFLGIPIAHYAGGQITEGAVDNIYRYNISNLSTLHFVTSQSALERLIKLPTIVASNVFCVGSAAIDSIYKFKNNPIDLLEVDGRLKPFQYGLMTFHPVTKSDEIVSDVVDSTIEEILNLNKQVLVTYPNNDDGNQAIIDSIEKWAENKDVVIIKNLGAERYYAAIYYSAFVIGNSSSGIIEVPYFSKITINVGDRQKGRLKPKSVKDVPCSVAAVSACIANFENSSWKYPGQEYLYGRGTSVEKIAEILSRFFSKN